MISLGELADQLEVELVGDASCNITAVATLQTAGSGQVSFLANSRYRRYLISTQASAVILRPEDRDAYQGNALVSDNPYLTYARAASLLNPQARQLAGCHPSAVVELTAAIDPTAAIAANCYVAADASIGPGAQIGAGCAIGKGVSIGADSRLAANVSIADGVQIGQRVLIHSGSVIGSDGFGFAPDQGKWFKVPQLGSVIIGDDVEVGANTTIDRGALEDTVIEEGVKLDNQLQIAHNVRIGAHTAIAGATAIAGSTTIGKRCQIGGAVGIVGHLTIADDVHITAMSLVTGNIKQSGLYSSGTPLAGNKEWRKNAARFGQLDDMARRLRALEKQLKEK